MNIKIFRANRGEGKTKWLFERAIEERDNGKYLYYVGNEKTMKKLINMWEVTFHEKCPIVRADDVEYLAYPHSFFTDEMMSNMCDVNNWLSYAKQVYGEWYITMYNENFVN